MSQDTYDIKSVTVNLPTIENLTIFGGGGSSQQQRNETTETNNYCEGIWQRVFDGQIPALAVAGGYDHAGELCYIGRTHYQHGEKMFLIPGKICASHRCMYFPYRGEKSSKMFDVLVNRDGRQIFKWLQWSSGSQIPPNAVIGGYQDNNPTFIGRRLHEGCNMVVGKIEPTLERLYITYAGKEIPCKSGQILVLMPDYIVQQTTNVQEPPAPTPNFRQHLALAPTFSNSEFPQGVNYDSNNPNYNNNNNSSEFGFRSGFVYGQPLPPPPPYPSYNNQPSGSGMVSMEVGGTAASMQMPDDGKKIGLGAFFGAAVAGAEAVSSLMPHLCRENE